MRRCWQKTQGLLLANFVVIVRGVLAAIKAEGCADVQTSYSKDQLLQLPLIDVVCWREPNKLLQGIALRNSRHIFRRFKISDVSSFLIGDHIRPLHLFFKSCLVLFEPASLAPTC
jgi:hypothetical protein